MKAVFARVMPTTLRRRGALALGRWRVRKEFALDRRRYLRHALPAEHLVTDAANERQLEGQLTKDYHRIEKGLALRQPKRPFGAEVASRLDRFTVSIPEGSALGGHVSSARVALDEWNAGGVADDAVSPVRVVGDRGIKNPDLFFGTRHSVRDFSDRVVEPKTLESAVALAINTPSVCNRQAWNVRFSDGEAARSVLRFQNGSGSFNRSVPVVAIVTVDTRLFAAASERNQPWIEGGLFAMSLVWALHALGLDACMLNMSVSNETAGQLRSVAGIDDAELVVMMIAIGYGREGHRRARSPRRAVGDVLRERP